MSTFSQEPVIRAGIIPECRTVRFEIAGQYLTSAGAPIAEGTYQASILADGAIAVDGPGHFSGNAGDDSPLTFAPADFSTGRVTIHGVVIGREFHWEREETQSFQGALSLIRRENSFAVVNELPVEAYLTSVISSEMSASCPPDLLMAHAVVSRSWLLAQLANKEAATATPRSYQDAGPSVASEIIRWYDREAHDRFDVCADDHCQRYQGITKAFTPEANEAVRETRGCVMMWEGEICDTRYSKSCGGMTEIYPSAWEEKEVPYLKAVYDGEETPAGYDLPLSIERNAEAWITGDPEAYCKAESPDLLKRILPGFDQETLDFYRWEVRYTQDELRELVTRRLGLDPGQVLSLEADERGPSGRIVRLKIIGRERTVVIGKELEIRRALSRSHLYSSAFVVRPEEGSKAEIPAGFRLIGAGWGHGVGLCQIGAAVMADQGHVYQDILSHYFRGAALQRLYD